MKKILIFDFGSQYTQLIARRVRELEVFCEILPFSSYDKASFKDVVGIILSGSPSSVYSNNAPAINWKQLSNIPHLGVCYGAQRMAYDFDGEVKNSQTREYGPASLSYIKDHPLNTGITLGNKVWMSHGDTIAQLPNEASIIASTKDVPIAAFEVQIQGLMHYGIQFHPEVYHSENGLKFLSNFVFGICKSDKNWTSLNFVDQSVEEIRAEVGSDEVLLGLSGGVDSSVAALLLDKAIGKKLHCFFIDNGLLRLNEYEEVLKAYENLGLQITGIDAKAEFYSELKGISDPETKRKTIGRVFIEVFEREAKKLSGVKYLAQGTIYPDVIESVSVNGPSVSIKSHHNVGGLPDRLNLKIIEPLRMLFKDEVRRVGKSLELEPNILNRHPFPGPGLAIRILGDITPEKVDLLQKADQIYIDLLKKHDWYDKIWQAGAILLPISSVGVMGDERTYEKVVALRAVSSTDGMTAEWSQIPYQLMGEISSSIINNVKGINRVVYDISTKPPSTIEWE